MGDVPAGPSLKARRLILKASGTEAPAPLALGKTRSGKPVHVAGADTKAYGDADHVDAAALHLRASAYHKVKHAMHRQAADGDDDWRRSEGHHDDAEHHGKLAEHHEDLARLHLTAAGKAGAAPLHEKGGRMELGDVTPASDDERKAARDELAKRTAHGLPAALRDSDRAAYAKLGEGKP